MNISKLTSSEISDIRQSLLKASLSERQTIAWRVKWEELQGIELELVQRAKSIPDQIYPWANRCNDSLILAWRDYLYKDIKEDSMDLELANEFSLSQDLFKRRVVKRPGLLAKLQAWIAKKVEEQSRQMKLQSATSQQGKAEGAEESEDSWDDKDSLKESEGQEEEDKAGTMRMGMPLEDGVPEAQAHVVSVAQSDRLSYLQVCVLGAQAAVAIAVNQMEKACVEYTAKVAGMEKAMARCEAEIKLADQCRGSIASTALRARSTAERKRHAKDKKEVEDR